MPRARETLISLSDTPYYHCVSRCVRRSFLCGEDPVSGKSYEHRRQWVEDRLLLLAEVYAIDLCAYAVMSNHTHVVLRINEKQAQAWDDREVIERWHRLYAGNSLSQRYMAGQALDDAQFRQLSQYVETWRNRLFSISWFMRNLNEHIAREANKEDQCTGRFWEGRFKSQALLDEKALAACMAYVDLNPIRAKMADSPETSDHTSVKKRIQSAKQSKQPCSLLAFVGNPCQDMPDGLPFPLQDYLQLVDWTGRHMREDKRGAIDSALPPILNRLGINQRQWSMLTQEFEQQFYQFAGSRESVENIYQRRGYQRKRGLDRCAELFPS